MEFVQKIQLVRTTHFTSPCHQAFQVFYVYSVQYKLKREALLPDNGLTTVPKCFNFCDQNDFRKAIPVTSATASDHFG